jgi:hypothetical protein
LWGFVVNKYEGREHWYTAAPAAYAWPANPTAATTARRAMISRTADRSCPGSFFYGQLASHRGAHPLVVTDILDAWLFRRAVPRRLNDEVGASTRSRMKMERTGRPPRLTTASSCSSL